jgi:hypothetical protein
MNGAKIMASWERNTPWRQGNIVPYEVAEALGLLPNDAPDTAVFVVISHDCDLAQPPGIEPHVEIIVGRKIEAIDGNFAYGKTARRLHLTYSGGPNSLLVELLATEKKFAEKLPLSEYTPLTATRLTAIELRILQRWLAARYRRSAFPDEFDRRLVATGIHDRISKILKTSGDLIAAIYFDVDEGKDISRSDSGDVYTLSIYLLFSTEIDPNAAEAIANNAKEAIKKAFQEKCVTKGSGAWHDIELVECEAISDQAMTVQQADLLKRWSADHLSLRTDPPQPMLNDG